MIHEERGLRSLNQVIASITEITASDEIQASIAEAGLLLKDTVESLKTAVDQVMNVAVTVQTVVDDVSVLTEQIPEPDRAQLLPIFKDFLNSYQRQFAGSD